MDSHHDCAAYKAGSNNDKCGELSRCQGYWWRGGKLMPHYATNAPCLWKLVVGTRITNLQIPRTPGGANGKGPSFA